MMIYKWEFQSLAIFIQLKAGKFKYLLFFDDLSICNYGFSVASYFLFRLAFGLDSASNFVLEDCGPLLSWY
jgi:hypothetical protein